jgi:hypothetical protein
MSKASTIPRWRSSVVAGVTAVALMAPVGWALIAGSATPATRLELTSGTAWLLSPGRGWVTLIDGPSEQVVATLSAESVGPGLSITQDGDSAFVIDDAAGTIKRIDGSTYNTSEKVEFGSGGSDLEVLTGGETAYVIDPVARTASVVDPESLRVLRTVSLQGRPGPQQTLATPDGRLWTVDADGGGLGWVDPDGSRGSRQVSPTTRLIAVNDRAALLDPDVAQPDVEVLDANGTGNAWDCRLGSRPGDELQLLGAASDSSVYAAISQSGTLLIASAAGSTGGDCGAAIPIGKPGARFGPLVESGDFVFVPNRATGEAVVVDVRTATNVATLPLTDPGNDLELISKDGLVFYNDLSAEKAGVLKRGPDGQWVAGQPLRKFDPENGTPESFVSNTPTSDTTSTSGSTSGSSPSGPPTTDPPTTVDSSSFAPVTTSTSTSGTLTSSRPPSPGTSDPSSTNSSSSGSTSSSSSSGTPPPPPPPGPPVITAITIDGSGGLSDHSSGAFRATVTNAAGDFAWSATTNIGALLGATLPDASVPYEVDLEGGVTSVSVTLVVGSSAPKTVTFPVQPRLPTSASVDWTEPSVWTGTPFNISVHVERSDLEPGNVDGHVVLLRDGTPIREGDLAGDGSDLLFNGITVDSPGQPTFTARYEGSAGFQPTTSIGKYIDVTPRPSITSAQCVNNGGSWLLVVQVSPEPTRTVDFYYVRAELSDSAGPLDGGEMNEFGPVPGWTLDITAMVAVSQAGGRSGPTAAEITVTSSSGNVGDLVKASFAISCE